MSHRKFRDVYPRRKKCNQKSINDPNAERQLPHVFTYMCVFIYWEGAVERES